MRTATAWALTTSEGIILFDAMFHHNVEETVVASMRSLGLDPADIEYVIVSHAYNDHFGDDVHYVGYWGASSVSFLPSEGVIEYMGSAIRIRSSRATPAFARGCRSFTTARATFSSRSSPRRARINALSTAVRVGDRSQ